MDIYVGNCNLKSFVKQNFVFDLIVIFDKDCGFFYLGIKNF